ncbi:MAG: VanZ family protein [Promethearchaeota archaeon]
MPAFIFAGVIFFISSLSDPYPISPPEPPRILELEISITDILHIYEYTILSLLVAFGFFDKAKTFHLILATFVYAILDEIHQYFVPNHYFSFYDILLDSIGVILGFLFYIILINLMNKLKMEKS